MSAARRIQRDAGRKVSEITGRRSEVGGQMSEVRGRRSEVRGQRSEVRGQRSEGRGQRAEVNPDSLVMAQERTGFFHHAAKHSSNLRALARQSPMLVCGDVFAVYGKIE